MHNKYQKSSYHRPIARLVCFATVISAVFGCSHPGPAYYPISGKVTFQGKPVAVGSIQISNPKAGIDVVTPLNPDGQYTIITANRKGLPDGDYQVAIMPNPDFSKVQMGKNGRPIPSTMPSFEELNPPNIPSKYHDPMTSGLTLTVKPEANVLDIDMH
jgi:hypothetical protein